MFVESFGRISLFTTAIIGGKLLTGLPLDATVIAPPPPTIDATIHPGEAGKVGAAYTVGEGGRAYRLTVRKFSFVATRLILNGTTLFPDGDKKFLVVDYAMQNPSKTTSFQVYNGDFSMTAIDSAGQKHDLEESGENTTSEQPLVLDLKPGQRVECRRYFVLPAAARVPKLLLGIAGASLVRFDLRTVVTPVEPIVADPLDKTGATSRARIADARIGVSYPTGPFDLTLEKVEFTDLLFNGIAPDAGMRFLVATIRAKNALTPAGGDADIRNAGNASYRVLVAGGQWINWTGDYFAVASDEPAKSSIPPGFEKRFRLCFQVPKNGDVQSLEVAEGERYRKLIYNLRGKH